MPVNIIDTLKPKNGGSFPIVEAIDVFVENYGNLAEAVSHFATDIMIEAINTVLSDKANTRDVNTAVANLQGQIDQIVISASAEAVVAPEVAAARVDSNGVEYSTLKERLDADANVVTDLDDSINPTKNFSFEQGTIYNGRDDTSTQRIRMESAAPIYGKISVSFIAPYSALVNFYTSEMTWISAMEWQNSSFVTEPPANAAFYRVVIRHTDNTNIVPSESENVTIKVINTHISESLELVPVVDERSTNNQNEISNLKGKFFDLTYVKSLDIYDESEFDLSLLSWKRAVPNPTTGIITNSDTRICTQKIGIPYLSNGLRISFDTNYKLAYYFYDSNGNFIQGNFWYTTSPKLITFLPNAAYIILTLAHSNDTTISVEDKSAITSISSLPTLGALPIRNDNNLFNFVIGTLNPATGREDENQKRIRSNYLYFGKKTQIKYVGNDNCLIVYEFEKDKKTLRSSSGWTDGNIYTVSADGYCRILLRKDSNNTSIATEDIAELVSKLSIITVEPIATYDSLLEAKIDIPSYYGDLSTEISKVNSNAMAAGINGITFVFCTDLHWENNAKTIPTILKRLKDSAIRSNYMIIGGDLINGGGKSSAIANMKECADALYDAEFKTFFVNGNHDNNSIPSGNELITYNEFYAIAQYKMPSETVYGNYAYFYYDDSLTKTRFMFLDSGFTDNTSLSNEQSEFIDNTLVTTPSGWHIVACWHIVYSIASGTTWETVPLELAPTGFSQAVFTKLDAHNSTADSTVEAVIGGHVHSDWDFATTGGIPIVLTDTAGLYALNGGTATRGTTSETVCDIITINYNDKVIDCVRIGRGSDRTIEY